MWNSCFNSVEYSFTKVNQKANQVAHTLEKLGITREEKMSLLMNNKPEVFYILYGGLLDRPISFFYFFFIL